MDDYSQILNSLLATGPLSAILFFALIKLWSKIQDKDVELRQMYENLREIERTNTTAFNNLAQSITNLSELIRTIINKEK